MAKIDGHDYVEIAGIKWATMNIGANSVTDYGQYFQWGDTAGYYSNQVGSSSTSYKKPFTSNDYKFDNGSNGQTTGLTKYNANDSKTILDVCDDAATNNWGGRWRTPTKDEWQTLGEAVNTAWTASYQGSGVAGLVCTDKTDSSKVLFFPAAGYFSNGSVGEVGSFGHFWSSSLYRNMRDAYLLAFSSSSSSWGASDYRHIGYPVRAVAEGSFSRTLSWKVAPTTIDIGNTLSIEAVPTIHENDGVLQYTSSDPSIVKILGSSIVGVSNGSCTITATITEGTFTNSASTSFSVTCSGSHAGHEYVSLGLPSGTLWATMNVGASTETASGKYYVYGAGQYDYNQNRSPYSGMENPLPSPKDTATQVWGGSWRTPSSDQCNELIDHTTITWETNFKGSGVTGAKLTAANGQYLFFPACGAYFNGSIEDVNVRAYSWTSTPDVSASYGNRDANFLLLRDCDGRTGSYYRQYGYPVRPVYKKITYEYVDLGLPSGTKWAKTNVGAETETEYGGYYMYGSGNMPGTSGSYYSGTEDPLPSSADTATQVMGSQWHMPTQGQFNELRNNTTFSFISINGVRGAKFTADNGNYIFFPCAGNAQGGDVYNVGYYIYCWTSNCDGYSGGAYALKSANGSYSINMTSRQMACSVRGVI